jgi:uncharacterized membrane protein YeaQ/YmgE (transglycosylase-associated protein family)
MGIIAWIVFGLIAGFLAKFLMTGKAPGGILATILLGIVGAVVGGFSALSSGSETFRDLTCEAWPWL